MSQRKIIAQEAIQSEYLDKPVSMKEACRVLGCSPKALVRLMAEYGLPNKPRGWNHARTNRYPQLQDRAWLAAQLETKPAQHIAQELGTTSGNVSDFMKRYGLRAPTTRQAIQEGIKKAFPQGRILDHARFRPFHYQKVYKPDHPYASKTGYVLRHRLVVEEELGRYLLPGETVHHKNHDPHDDRPENLVVFSTSAEHTKYHHEERRQRLRLRPLQARYIIRLS